MEQRWRPPTVELLTGLYGYRIPTAFYLVGSADGVAVHIGTWSARKPVTETQDRRIEVVESVLRGLYPVLDGGVVEDQGWSWPLSGIALGVPAPAGVAHIDRAAPIDRVIRALAGSDWAVLVLAYPAGEHAVSQLRDGVLNEMRSITQSAQAEGGPSPLAEQYIELLKLSLNSLGEGLATGAWRTATYLLGDNDSYPRLATAWRSVFSGRESLPEPVRVFDCPEADALAQAWAMPDQEAEAGPGHYRRPFEFQTLLTTAQLASYIHLPELEAPGFSVSLAARFDAIPATADADRDGVSIGQVIYNEELTGACYQVPLRTLTRHVFVAGVTGAGKTNTVLSLLTEADAAGVPFLVIEPAKTEYRSLIAHPKLGKRVRVYTVGNPTVAPLVLNPFEVPAGTTVNQHLDLLRAAFAAAFGMWTPLPQLLERCLHEVYADRGWDLRTNTNVRLASGDNSADAFPTLGDLGAKVAEVIPTLGYEDKVAGDLRAALVTRLESLRTGGKGAMLDVSRSVPIEELLSQPTVLELESMGDDGDKAFLTALMLIRLAEHRRAQGEANELVHLLVVEEAHRLLANVPMQLSEESSNPRGQAVQTFTNLLSEVRAYGQGIVIADQIPVRLAPDVIKNTELKIAHRLVSADDRETLAGAMAMNETQARALTTLDVGETAVFSVGDDSPIRVRIPLVKDSLSSVPPADDEVAEHMAESRSRATSDSLFLARPFCAETCRDRPQACEMARRLVADEYVQRCIARTVLSTIEEPGALDRLWDDLLGVVRARRPPKMSEPALLRAFAGHAADWYAQRRGAQEVWSYRDTSELADVLRAVLLDKLEGRAKSTTTKLRANFATVARRLAARTYAPYLACERVCNQQPPLCLYRSAVADLVASRRYQPSWTDADAADAASEGSRRQRTWEVCQDAAYELIEFPDPDASEAVNAQLRAAAKRVCICFEQQMLADDHRKVPRTSGLILARVLAEAEL